MTGSGTATRQNNLPWEICPNCGSESTVPVWNTPAKFREGMSPDYVGCTDCNEMEQTEDWGDE